jgi:hypothetical protein
MHLYQVIFFQSLLLYVELTYRNSRCSADLDYVVAREHMVVDVVTDLFRETQKGKGFQAKVRHGARNKSARVTFRSASLLTGR